MMMMGAILNGVVYMMTTAIIMTGMFIYDFHGYFDEKEDQSVLFVVILCDFNQDDHCRVSWTRPQQPGESKWRESRCETRPLYHEYHRNHDHYPHFPFQPC